MQTNFIMISLQRLPQHKGRVKTIFIYAIRIVHKQGFFLPCLCVIPVVPHINLASHSIRNQRRTIGLQAVDLALSFGD